MSEELVAAVAGLAATVAAMADQNTRDHAGVRQTLAGLSEKVGDMNNAVARTETLMEGITKTTDDHETRIRSVERWGRGLAGGMAAVGVLATYIFAWAKGLMGTGT